MELGIAGYSHIDPSKVVKGDKVLYKGESMDFNNYAKEVYRKLDLSYPKFYKMDELCKLAFLAAEALLSDKEFDSESDGADIAIILGNRSSSIASDKKHHQAIKNSELPSPAIFVYTLPNIMLGELCIRHKVTGENSCFLMDKFDTSFFYNYVKNLFVNEGYKYCITGWVDYQENEFIADLFLVEKTDQNKEYINKFDLNFY
ncbi:MAG: hypothetical protein ACNS60_05995 [Candidatus Cyclobacteriaceae bacterium M2_1C_046]